MQSVIGSEAGGEQGLPTQRAGVAGGSLDYWLRHASLDVCVCVLGKGYLRSDIGIGRCMGYVDKSSQYVDVGCFSLVGGCFGFLSTIAIRR